MPDVAWTRLLMSGWDRDERGDYTPPPVPKWIWMLAICVMAAFIALVAFGPR